MLKAVQDGVESDLVPATTDGSLQPDHWYQLDLVVGLSKVTLYTDGQEKIAWQRGSSPRLTGSRGGRPVRAVPQFQELEQWDVGRVTKTYSSGGQRVALRRDSALYFVHTDHLGSSSLLTTETGQEAPGTRLKYFAYGAPRPDTATATHDAFTLGYTPATYTGQPRDASTGLMYYGTRFYDPALGRFISPDTIVPSPGNPQSLNRYAYGLNNPLRYTDPDGHSPVVVGALVALGPVGWVILGVGAVAGTAVLSYQYGWGPNAADNRAAATDTWNGLTTKVSHIPETIAEKMQTSPEVQLTTMALMTGKAALDAEGNLLNAKPNQDGNRGAEPAIRTKAQQYGKLPPDKESPPAPPMLPDSHQKPPTITLPPASEVLKNLDPHKVGWGSFLFAKGLQLLGRFAWVDDVLEGLK